MLLLPPLITRSVSTQVALSETLTDAKVNIIEYVVHKSVFLSQNRGWVIPSFSRYSIPPDTREMAIKTIMAAGHRRFDCNSSTPANCQAFADTLSRLPAVDCACSECSLRYNVRVQHEKRDWLRQGSIPLTNGFTVQHSATRYAASSSRVQRSTDTSLGSSRPHEDPAGFDTPKLSCTIS